MNVNIYYGGRGLVDDPTIVVINRIQEVLEELNVHVTRYNLYEIKNTITTPPIISHELLSAVTTSRSPYALDITTGNIYVDDVLLLSAYSQQESRSVCI